MLAVFVNDYRQDATAARELCYSPGEWENSITEMLDAGFEPSSCPFLHMLIRAVGLIGLKNAREKYDIPCP